VIYSAKVFFNRILSDPSGGPSLMFELWTTSVNLTDIFYISAQQALEEHSESLSGKKNITNFKLFFFLLFFSFD
jgi:hypothetical protein